MIFSRFFRSKTQDPDPQVRLKAIQDLDPLHAEHKSQLHELAFNDEDVNVSLAALHKLDSFALWTKTAQTGSSERLRKKATQQVETILLQPQANGLDGKHKRTYLLECNNHKLIEKLLLEDLSLRQDPGLCLELLSRLNKPQFSRQFFFQCDNPEVQMQLLDNFTSDSDLQRVVRKINDPVVVDAAANKLKQLQLQREKPPVIIKQSRLILSKLLALKDNQDYPRVAQKRSELEADFAAQQAEFSWLSQEDKSDLIAKFTDISHKLDTHMALLQPQWQQLQVSIEAQHKAEAAGEKAQQVLSDVEQMTASADLTSISTGDIEQAQTQLQHAASELTAALDNNTDIDSDLRYRFESLHNRLLSAQSTLASLPELQRAVAQAEALLEEVTALPLPEDDSQSDAAKIFFSEQKHQWRELSKGYEACWPSQLQQRWQQWTRRWQQALEQIRQQTKKQVTHCRNTIRTINGMVSQGRFRAAIGLYKKLKTEFAALPERAQSELQRSFDKVSEQIVNLQDWQNYIAEPRKPEVLKQVEALLEQPEPIDIPARASQVKALRAEWRSLGVNDSESDQALNTAFDQAIEKAFQPCREHYAEQQQQRDNNLQVKHNLLQQLDELSHQTIEDKELANKVRQLQQQWSQSGEVDYRQRDQINQSYRDVMEPLQQRVKDYYQGNQEAKERLVRRARDLEQVEDVADAVQQAMQLQQQWKQIDFAGHKADNKLWKQFRQANDDVFARRKAQTDAQRQETDQQLAGFEQILSALAEDLANADQLTSLSELKNRLQQADTDIDGLPQKLQGRQRKRVSQLQQQLEDKQSAAMANQIQRQYQQLFACLREWLTDAVPDDVAELPSRYRQWFESAEQPDDRESLTLSIEIIADLPSPKAAQAQRQKIQMQLMQDKLENGVAKDLNELLAQWVACGPLSKGDVKRLARIEKAFVAG